MRSVMLALVVVAAAVVGASRAEAQVVTLAEAARPAADQGGTGTVRGVVDMPPGVSADALVVRLRDMVTSEIRATTVTGPGGEFSFAGLRVSDYFLEVLDQNGLLLSVSNSLRLGAGEIVEAILRPASRRLAAMFPNVMNNGANAFTNAATGVLTRTVVPGITPPGSSTSPER